MYRNTRRHYCPAVANGVIRVGMWWTAVPEMHQCILKMRIIHYSYQRPTTLYVGIYYYKCKSHAHKYVNNSISAVLCYRKHKRVPNTGTTNGRCGCSFANKMRFCSLTAAQIQWLVGSRYRGDFVEHSSFYPHVPPLCPEWIAKTILFGYHDIIFARGS